MKYARRLLAASVAMLLLLVVLPRAEAAPAPEPERKGSITLCLTWQGKPLSGGRVILYRVAERNDRLEYVPVPDFEGCGEELFAPATAKIAASLAKYAEDRGISGQMQAIDSSGTAAFHALEPGLYLLVQEAAHEGYMPFRPFLVSIPQHIGDELLYDVDASPKVAAEPESPPPPGLPQTGQTNWPVPVLGIPGLILVLRGAVLCLPQRRKHRET